MSGAATAVAQQTALPSNCAQSGAQVTCTYGYTGAEQTFVVPAGVTKVDVTAIGAAGGSGGAGAQVGGPIAVASGSTLYVEVGQAGGRSKLAGTFNGGGGSEFAFQGGGASDVRTASGGTDPAATALESRVIVAGGGGGKAEFEGGPGGAAGQDGAPATQEGRNGQGGRAGSTSAGGAGGARGTGVITGDNGGSGQLGRGGTGGEGFASAGGGGGGFYGGGGGGGGAYGNSNFANGGGGGGGSSLVPSGGSGPSLTTAPAAVTISYFLPGPAAIAATSGSGQSASAGQPFAQPLVATVTDASGAPFAGAPVTFTISGPASFGGASTATVTTGADGRATSPTVTAGSSPGQVSVSATTPGVTGAATFTLTVTAPGAVKGGGTLTASDGQRYSVAVDARATAAGQASGRFAFSGGGADTTASSRTITSVRRTATGGTVTGTAITSRGQTVSFTLTVVDGPGGRDQVTVQLGNRTVTGTLTTGDIATS